MDNLRYHYDGASWTPDSKCYWADDETRADFYTYYPYRSSDNPFDVAAFAVSVPADQSSAESFKTGYFLWGKTSGVSPTPDPVSVSLKHSMSCLCIKLVADEGFTAEDVEGATVTICNLKTEGSIDLATGALTASGGIVDVTPLRTASGEFRALLLPQTASDVNLVKIVADGKEYHLNQSITLSSGKQHSCTITLKKTAQGLNVGLIGWDQDDMDYGGIVG